ncbi:MAG: WD40/YVTN/BNR-like repeat-containing protein [Streptosporangiaceae bacterium]
MPDEIDLLRWFRGDTPDPDGAAWSRARTLVDEVRAERHGTRGTLRWWQQIRWRPGRRVTITAAVAILVTVAALIAVVLQGPPTLSGPLTSAWQPARPLPGGAQHPGASSGTWRLTSYLVARGWHENTAGPEPGLLTCPTASTCYVEGDNSTSPSGPADMDSLYISTDGAQTWSVLPVPYDLTFTSELSCASATDCAAAGLYYGHQPVYLTTANGGHSWTVNPLPADVGQIISLYCATATTCRGLASATGKALSPGFSFIADMRFFVTSDDGRHFTVRPFPSGESIVSVSCPTALHCVAIGVYDKLDAGLAPNLDHGVLLTSDDGGMTWRQRTWPVGFGPGATPRSPARMPATAR